VALSVLVIGGGIGGLAAATALARRGMVVHVVEQSPEITEVGAGLQVSPNGLAVLRALGVETELERSGAVAAQAVVLREHAEGRVVARLDLARYGAGQYLFVHRAELVATLLQAAREAGVALNLAHRVTAVRPGARPEVVFADGRALRADVVVAADGLHSVARAAVAGASTPRFTGQVAWRAVVPVERAEPVATVSMGPGRHLVSYPLRGGTALNLVAVEERETWTEEGWHHRDDPDHLRAAFAEFGAPVQGWLERVEVAHLWGLFRHPVAETWARGNVALLGDAAHPTLPFLAQGANMALEDAWVLAEVLARGGDLGGYQEARRARTMRIVETAAGNAWKYHLRPGPFRWAAHRALALGSRLLPGRMVGQFDWLYGHDVTREFET
jgi:salicylate hydroxylase